MGRRGNGRGRRTGKVKKGEKRGRLNERGGGQTECLTVGECMACSTFDKREHLIAVGLSTEHLTFASAVPHRRGDFLIDDRLYSAILRSLEQTHCARMWFYMSD